MRTYPILCRYVRMARVGNEEASRRAGIDNELKTKVDQRVFKWHGLDTFTLWPLIP